MHPFDWVINKAAQGFITKDEALEWFRSLSPEDQRTALGHVYMDACQAHPLKTEVDPAITASRLKATYTPCVILKRAEERGEYPERVLYKIVGLSPEYERERAFILLLSLFTIADRRRRETQCVNGCSHEWHHIQPITITWVWPSHKRS